MLVGQEVVGVVETIIDKMKEKHKLRGIDEQVTSYVGRLGEEGMARRSSALGDLARKHLEGEV